MAASYVQTVEDVRFVRRLLVEGPDAVESSKVVLLGVDRVEGKS